MCTDTLVNVCADRWSTRGAEISGMTRWITNEWKLSHLFVDLIYNQRYPSSGEITAQAVLNAVQEHMPDSAQLFMATPENVASARLAGDALSGMSGYGYIFHLLWLYVKIYVLKNYSAASVLEAPLEKLRNLSTSLTRPK